MRSSKNIVIIITLIISIIVSLAYVIYSTNQENFGGGATMPFTITNKQSTPMNDDGRGNAIFLDRHDMNCGNAPINQFRLQRNSDLNQYQFNYKCSSAMQLDRPIGNATPWNDEGGGNAVFLDRHNVDCGANNVLTRTHLRRKGDGNYQYEYSCARSNRPLKCRKATTGFNDEGDGNSVYLDRHNVECNGDEALSQFHLQRSGLGTYQFQFTCCKY